eukprot:3391373-Amphidinium_carterae.1
MVVVFDDNHIEDHDGKGLLMTNIDGGLNPWVVSVLTPGLKALGDAFAPNPVTTLVDEFHTV